MKNLRGRPINISESGIVYLDSDEIFDSEVEPVFFPAAEFELGEALEEAFAGDVGDDDDEEDQNDNNSNRGRFFQLIHALDSDDDDSSGDKAPAGVHVGGQEVHHRSVIQYFGGTVQVRHIVHENFTQLQQQQAQNTNNSNSSSSSQQNPPSQSQQLPALTSSGTNTEPVQIIYPSALEPEIGAGTRPASDDSEGEPPSICETGIVIRFELEGNFTGGLSRMTEQSNELIRLDVEETPRPADDQNVDGSANKLEAVKVLSPEDSGANLSGGSSGLVPYPDLPDYASAGEDDEDDFLQASIPAPYKSTSPEASSSTSQRLSLKRKEPDTEEDDDDEELDSPEKSSRKRIVENTEKLSDEEADREEETCNPMVSDEECSETEEAFRGDRIGNTVYSERHVLKILMKWIQELPQYSIENLMKAREKDETEEEIEKRIQRLNTEFEEQMSLLWDMSSEKDVMSFLVENKIFTFIRDTIDRSACNRLTEIALGILANVISEPSIIEDFTVHDSSIQLVEKVVELCTKVSDVAVLIQVFSVLRRIVWYLRNVSSVKKWTDLLQSSNFLGCANFIMSSSRNALTRSDSLEYFALSLHLLSFCHTSLGTVNPAAITTPISTASKLMSQEERDKEVDMVIRVQLKDGVEFDSVSYIALVAHEYLASVAEKFGPEPALKARNSASYDKFFAVLDKVLAQFSEEGDMRGRNNGFGNSTQA